MRISLPSGDEDGDDAVLEPERWLWVDSLRAAARGEARLRATSTMHSTSASTKFNLANVSLCSFCGNDAIEFVCKRAPSIRDIQIENSLTLHNEISFDNKGHWVN
jgi:hypothetical protein